MKKGPKSTTRNSTLQQIKNKPNRRKDITKIRAEINEFTNRKNNEEKTTN